MPRDLDVQRAPVSGWHRHIEVPRICGNAFNRASSAGNTAGAAVQSTNASSANLQSSNSLESNTLLTIINKAFDADSGDMIDPENGTMKWKGHTYELGQMRIFRARFERLRAWRRDRASEQHVPPYVIFQDKTLLEIAQAQPRDLTALAALPGVGQSKLDRYGKGVLETLAKGLESVDGRPSDIIDKARDLRRDMSLPEVQLWQALRGEKLGGLKFRRQHPIAPYVLDFYCAGVRLAVEIDGDSHDGRAAQDARRDAFLLEQGIRTLRIAARDVLNDLPAVTDHIYREAKGQ